MDTDQNRQEIPDDEHTVFIPPQDIQAIERVIQNLDRAQEAFLRAAEEMKLPDNREPDKQCDKTNDSL